MSAAGTAKPFSWGRLLLGAWTALVYVFLYLPIVVLIVFSFNEARQTAVWQGFTFKWYAALADNERILGSVRNSLVVAALTTIISTVVGTCVALALGRYKFRGQGVTQAMLYLLELEALTAP